MNSRLLIAAAGLLVSVAARGSEWTWQPPGALTAGSGNGATDKTVFSPNMRFPIAIAPAFANSQVYGRGGSKGSGGGQCDIENYSYPWNDNFCESRSFANGMCPAGKGHQGQDIRPPTCHKDRHWAVAVENGVVSSVGLYTVTLSSDAGSIYRYLHLNMKKLAIVEGQRVLKGAPIGLISNYFGNAPTTIHLHFEVHQNVNGFGIRPVPPYSSLVQAYKALINE